MWWVASENYENTLKKMLTQVLRCLAKYLGACKVIEKGYWLCSLALTRVVWWALSELSISALTWEKISWAPWLWCAPEWWHQWDPVWPCLSMGKFKAANGAVRWGHRSSHHTFTPERVASRVLSANMHWSHLMLHWTGHWYLTLVGMFLSFGWPCSPDLSSGSTVLSPELEQSNG
jgi:hypothetical protein